MMEGNALPRLLRDDRGTSAIEMGLLCAFLVLAIFVALSEFAGENDKTWTTVSTKVRAAHQKAEQN